MFTSILLKTTDKWIVRFCSCPLALPIEAFMNSWDGNGAIHDQYVLKIDLFVGNLLQVTGLVFYRRCFHHDIAWVTPVCFKYWENTIARWVVRCNVLHILLYFRSCENISYHNSGSISIGRTLSWTWKQKNLVLCSMAGIPADSSVLSCDYGFLRYNGVFENCWKFCWVHLWSAKICYLDYCCEDFNQIRLCLLIVGSNIGHKAL